MAVKQQPGQYAPDGSNYVTLVDGDGNLINDPGAGTQSTSITDSAGNNPVAVSTPADATGTVNSLNTRSNQMLYNGSSWDRQRTISGASQTTSTGVAASVALPHLSAVAAIPSTATSVAASSIVLKASAGNLFSVCVNAGASAGYLLIFDATSAPADGVVTPVFSIPVAANSFYTTDWAYPIRCATGITLVFSTTGPYTKTASATAFLSGQFL